MLTIIRIAALGLLLWALLTAGAVAGSLPAGNGAKGFMGRAVGKIGQVIVVGGASLLMLCSQIGCGGDELEAGLAADEVTLVEETAPDRHDSDVEMVTPYSLKDYIGRYIVFVSDGTGGLDSGLVIGHGHGSGNFAKLIVAPEPQKHVPVKKHEDWGNVEIELVAVGGEVHVPLQTVIGVMVAQHDDLGALVEFDPNQARSQMVLLFADQRQKEFLRLDEDRVELILPDALEPPTLVRGTVSAVYLDPTHSSDAGIAVVSVALQSGFSNAEWHRLFAHNAFVPYDAVKHVD